MDFCNIVEINRIWDAVAKIFHTLFFFYSSRKSTLISLIIFDLVSTHLKQFTIKNLEARK